MRHVSKAKYTGKNPKYARINPSLMKSKIPREKAAEWIKGKKWLHVVLNPFPASHPYDLAQEDRSDKRMEAGWKLSGNREILTGFSLIGGYFSFHGTMLKWFNIYVNGSLLWICKRRKRKTLVIIFERSKNG